MQTYAWETQDGQKWLAKALDPAGMQSVDVKGLPDQEAHNVVVLNYQSQYTVDPPQMFGVDGNDASTYDAELFFYQDPIVFGVSAAYPTGTKDPMHDSKTITCHFGSTSSGATASPSISFNSTGTLFPRTCRRFVNSQLSGATTVSAAYDVLKGMAQRHRVIYGAAQLIPTCSFQDNSGSISVSQAPFIGDDLNHAVLGGRVTNAASAVAPAQWKTISTVNNNLCMYLSNDFPDTEDNIRNPASLLTRFYEGAYIPYKLKNPFQEDFINTADSQATLAPFWVIGAAYRAVSQTEYINMDWDLSSRSFVAPIDPSTGARTIVNADRLKLKLMSRTGAIKEIIIVYSGTTDGTADKIVSNLDLSKLTATNQDSLLQSFSALSSAGSSSDSRELLSDMSSYDCWNLSADAAIYVYRTGEEDGPRARLPRSNIAAALCKTMNMKGNITLLVRLGVEIVVTGSSTYSPFNHRSPSYDESAIKSYLRVIHSMSDAFYGNSATDYFHSAYYNHIIGLLYSPDETVDFANRGSYWRGVVSATR